MLYFIFLQYQIDTFYAYLTVSIKKSWDMMHQEMHQPRKMLSRLEKKASELDLYGNSDKKNTKPLSMILTNIFAL